MRAVGAGPDDTTTSAWSTHVTGSVESVDDHGDTEGTATAVRLPSTTSGELETAGDVDYFSFELESSGTLTVYTTGPTDTVGVVTSPSGLRQEDDDSGDDRNFSIVVSGASPGTYYVAVRGYGGSSLGGYELHTSFSTGGGGIAGQISRQELEEQLASWPQDFTVFGPYDMRTTMQQGTSTTMEICVRDHACEDGDRVAILFGRPGEEIFNGEIFNEWQCRSRPVRVGYAYPITVIALNGTGFKGLCNHANVNTGEIRVRLGNNRVSHEWETTGGAGSITAVNVRAR